MAQTQAALDLEDLRVLRSRAYGAPSVARYLFWGLIAIGSVLAAALIIATGAKRSFAVGEAKAPIPPVQRTQTVGEHELLRMNDVLRGLAAENNRLAARVERLEQAIDITASAGDTNAPLRGAGEPSPSPTATVVVPSRPGSVANRQPEVSAPSRTQSIPPGEAAGGNIEFAVDLGGEANIEGLRALWIALRTNHASRLKGLRPLVSIREGGTAGTVELRLIAGPLVDAGAAARICARLRESGAACETALFDGQRLTVR